MELARWLPRKATHLDERLIMAAAGDRGLMVGWSAEQRTHLLSCDRCRSLLDKHEELLSALGGEWGLRELPTAVPVPYLAPMPGLRVALTGLAVVALAVVVAGSWWALRSSPSAAQPSPSAAQPSLPSGTLFAVNPNGTSVDFDRCVFPAQDYGAGQPDWGEDYLRGGWLYLNFTGQPEEHVAAIRALLPSDCAIYVRVVPVSSAVGRALQSQIGNDMASLQAAGVPVNGVGFDPISDKVTVDVYPLTPQAHTELERRYPAQMLEITEQAPPVPVAS